MNGCQGGGCAFIVAEPMSAVSPSKSTRWLVQYLQGESNDFEALLHRVKLLLVEGVAHYVGP